jgi:hypothetical protein
VAALCQDALSLQMRVSSPCSYSVRLSECGARVPFMRCEGSWFP